MQWGLRSADPEPVKSTKLHLRLDHDLLIARDVGGYLKGDPLMILVTFHTHPANVGIIC